MGNADFARSRLDVIYRDVLGEVDTLLTRAEHLQQQNDANLAQVISLIDSARSQATNDLSRVRADVENHRDQAHREFAKLLVQIEQVSLTNRRTAKMTQTTAHGIYWAIGFLIVALVAVSAVGFSS